MKFGTAIPKFVHRPFPRYSKVNSRGPAENVACYTPPGKGYDQYLRPWSSWTANSDKKYMELNGAALNVNKPYVTSRKRAFPKDK